MKTAYYLIIGAGVATMSACAPITYLAMKPAAGSNVWYNGHERTVAAQDSVVVSVGFVRYEGNSLVFDVDIQNQSGKAVLVAPEQFTYLPIANSLHAGQQYIMHFNGPVTATNPEQKLDGLVAAVAYNVQESQRPMLLAPVDYAQQHRIEASTAAIQAQTQKQEAEAHLLRKNTLFPGQGIRGYVYFPRTNDADVLRLSLPLRTKPVEVMYHQVRSSQPAQ